MLALRSELFRNCIPNYQARGFKALSLKLFLSFKALSFSLLRYVFFFLEPSIPEARASAGLYFKKDP